MLTRRTAMSGLAAIASANLLLTRGARAQEAHIVRTDADWRSTLTPDQYAVLRKEGTERPFTSPLLHEERKGVFACAGCNSDLFSSSTKFDSGTGWPSFYEPAVAENVELHEDRSLGMARTEVRCKRCGGHLGHVFDDGPNPTGQRFCINSCALDLDKTAG